jgi:hypothetical protein
MEGFMNEFAANPQVLPALIVFVTLALPTFGYFYNRLMDKLNGTKEHLSLYVVGGVLVTLLAIGLFSWKAALIGAGCFALSGLPMITGEFKRTEEQKQTAKPSKAPRRKRLPYAANACIDDAYDAAREAHRLLGVAFKNNRQNPESSVPMAEASHQLTNAILKISELKMIQSGDEQ